MLYIVSGINSLDLFVNLILVPVPSFPTHLFLHQSLLPSWFATLHAHPYLPLSFTSGLKSTCFANPIPQFHFFLPDCLHGLLHRPSFLLSHSVFVFHCDRRIAWSPPVCVCMLVTLVSHAKRMNWSSLWGLLRWAQGPYIGWGPDPPRKGAVFGSCPAHRQTLYVTAAYTATKNQ